MDAENKNDWLPPALEFNDYCQWEPFMDALYKIFSRDFIATKPRFFAGPLRLKRNPVEKEKEATFWHFISEGKIEVDRIIDFSRAGKISWVKPIIEAAEKKPPNSSQKVIWWKEERNNEQRYVLALQDFSHIVVIADRKTYLLPWTQFPVERRHQREKLQTKFENYWKTRSQEKLFPPTIL